MSNFVQTVKLKGKAEEDIYFAKRNRELIEALHKKKCQHFDEDESQIDDAVVNRYLKESNQSIRSST